MKKIGAIVLVAAAVLAAGCSSSDDGQAAKAKKCVHVLADNLAVAKWNDGVEAWNALTQAQRDRYDDPKPGDPGGGYAAWAAGHRYPSVYPKAVSKRADACL